MTSHCRTALIAGLGLCTLATHAAAQDSDPRAVQPERPTVATHAHTVAPGYVEIEAGLQRDNVPAGIDALSYPVVVKFGLTSHTQLNVTVPLPSGAAIGLKWRLADDQPLVGDFALLPAVTFSSGGNYGMGVTAISSHELGGVSIDLNLAYQRQDIGTHTSRDAGLWTASFGLPVTSRFGWVVEFFGEPGTSTPAYTDGTSRVAADNTAATSALLTGPTFLVSHEFAVDAGIIAPLHGDTPRSFYTGFVWNVGRFLAGGPAAVRAARRR